MTARILAIGTAVPSTILPQEAVRDLFAAQPATDRLTRRLIHAAFDSAAIDRRHTVLSELGADAGAPPVAAPPSAAPPGAAPQSRTAGAGIHPSHNATGEQRGRGFEGREHGFLGREREIQAPSTGARNALYTQLAPGLFAEAACHALGDAKVPASAVTHVVTVSCTGFFAPGPDYRLVRDLSLSPTVARTHVGFMGCAAALPALRLAAQISTAEPEAVVLVVAAELCSLHIRASADPQQIVAASVFADGAAAAVVTADPRYADRRGLDLGRFGTTLTAEGEADMVWTIGDHGFEMTLSADVPRIIGREIRAAAEGFFGAASEPDAWAVHPGGRSVLDRVEAGLGLASRALAPSRDVLREYGNMSSATLLFILRALLHDETLTDGSTIAALAFGPGLTVESALLTKRETRVAADAALHRTAPSSSRHPRVDDSEGDRSSREGRLEGDEPPASTRPRTPVPA